MPPNFPVCKSSVTEIMEDLGLEFAFVHADEDILCKLYQIIWNHQDEQFKFIRLIMGGFHQIKVLLKIISKRHSCMGYEQWFVESGLIQAGSVETGFNGKKYYRTMQLLKAAFCTLIQFRFKSLKCADFELLDNGLLSQIVSLKSNTQKSTCDAILSSPAFSQLCNELTRVSGTQGKMTVEFLKDVSLVLSLISAARDNNFDLHLQAERQMILLTGAYDHYHYTRYLTYQHVLYSNLKHESSPEYRDLATKGFAASYSGNAFIPCNNSMH